MRLERPIGEYESVRNWRRRLVEQWGDDPLEDDPEKLEALGAFCEYVARDPDQLLSHCFLRKKETGARFASIMRRDEVASWLASWRDQSGKTGIAARKMTNDVLSFFIHGGAMMHPGMIPGRDARAEPPQAPSMTPILRHAAIPPSEAGSNGPQKR